MGCVRCLLITSTFFQLELSRQASLPVRSLGLSVVVLLPCLSAPMPRTTLQQAHWDGEGFLFLLSLPCCTPGANGRHPEQQPRGSPRAALPCGGRGSAAPLPPAPGTAPAHAGSQERLKAWGLAEI